MSISQVCAAASRSICPRLNYAFLILLTLFIFASATAAATLVVPAGGDLQAAINAAAPGDTIVLEAGATYRGPFWLPKKTGDAYITIQSSRAADIVGRVSPSQNGLLAKLRSNVGGDAIINTTPGAHHYKLIGLDISTFSSTDLVYDLVRLGDSNQTDFSAVPHHLVLDRLWIHGFATQSVQRGVSLNSADTSIINSYISDIHASGIDTQAICGWNGPGPYQIINNYLEAAGENVMFGGSKPAITNLVPSNIEIRRNHFFKPLSWKVGHPSYAGIHWSIKNLLEFKNARNVIIDGNVFENCWTDAQIGYAVLFTVASEEGTAPWVTVENISFTNNTVKNTEQVFQLRGNDSPHQSGRGNGLVIANNLFTGIADRFFTITGFYNITIDHNTHLQSGNVMAFHGEPSIGFVYTNNITTRSGFGFFGDGIGEGTAALTTYTPGFVFQRNLIAGASAAVYPANNFFPAAITGVLDSEFRVVNSTYMSAGTDGKALGCDITALNAAQSGDTPTPTPTPAATPTSGTESANNTRLPPAAQIIDSTGAVWTRTSNGAILRNGVNTSGAGSQILYCNSLVYVFGTDSQWWRWINGWIAVGVVDPCGGGSTSTPTPTSSTESPTNTRVPTATQIVDSTGAVWTRTSNGTILRNSAATGGTGSQILYCNRIVYVFGTDSQWWRWNNGWTPVGPVDPCGGGSTPTPTPTWDEVVLWAGEAPVRVGAWSVVADGTAAGGKRISNTDAGAAKRSTPLANPNDYFEMTFNATAGVDYRLWIRGRSQNDFWGNDSVFIQFSDSVNSSGAAVFRIGTTTAAEMNLEDCSGCALSGWGWQDNGWGIGVLGPLIRFATTGTHTIRIQVREDGLSIDQIVLSSQSFRNSAPGPLKNDATILPK